MQVFRIAQAQDEVSTKYQMKEMVASPFSFG